MAFSTRLLASFFLSSVIFTAGQAQEIVRSRIVDVQWPDDYTGAAAPVPDPRLNQVNGTLLPVKIPQRLLRFKTFEFIGEELFYTASVRLNRAKISVSGTRVASDGGEPLQGATSTPGEVVTTISEGAAFATMTESGAAYKVTVECVNPNAAICTQDNFVRKLMNEMIFIGGGKRAPTPLEGAAAPLPPATPFDANFAFRPGGELVASSGTGVSSTTIFAPNIRFPVDKAPAYLNSQVYGIGGQKGVRGSWKDARNYKYPWRDNFCEIRSRKTAACPSGSGHQGVDIRPSDARDLVHWAVAVEDGRITDVGVYSITLTGQSGTQFKYLHLEKKRLAVKQGDKVSRGQKVGLISDDFGGEITPVHLHFEILQNVSGKGYRHVPPYSSLVAAYKQGN